MGGYLSKGDAVLPTSSCILHFIFLNFVFWRGTTNSFPPVAIVVVAPLRQSCDKLWWGPFLPLASQMSPQPLNFQQILNYSNRRLNADKIRDIPSSSRFEVFFLQKELCWAQFDLAAHKKISFQVPVCKHQPEGELALKSEATPFPAYLKYSQGACLSLQSWVRGEFLPDLVLLHWKSSGPGGGWRGSTLQRNSIIFPPYVTLRPEWQQQKENFELSTSLDVLLPKEPLLPFHIEMDWRHILGETWFKFYHPSDCPLVINDMAAPCDLECQKIVFLN